MKLSDLNEVKKLDELLKRVQRSYYEQFKNKKNSLRVLICKENECSSDSTPMELLDLDVTLEGPIAALVDQSYRSKIEELKKRLQELGVDQVDETIW